MCQRWRFCWRPAAGSSYRLTSTKKSSSSMAYILFSRWLCFSRSRGLLARRRSQICWTRAQTWKNIHQRSGMRCPRSCTTTTSLEWLVEIPPWLCFWHPCSLTPNVPWTWWRCTICFVQIKRQALSLSSKATIRWCRCSDSQWTCRCSRCRILILSISSCSTWWLCCLVAFIPRISTCCGKPTKKHRQ